MPAVDRDVLGEEIHGAFSAWQMLCIPLEELGRVKRISRLAGRTEIRQERSAKSLLEDHRKGNEGSFEIGWFRDSREVSAMGTSRERFVEYQRSGYSKLSIFGLERNVKSKTL